MRHSWEDVKSRSLLPSCLKIRPHLRPRPARVLRRPYTTSRIRRSSSPPRCCGRWPRRHGYVYQRMRGLRNRHHGAPRGRS